MVATKKITFKSLFWIICLVWIPLTRGFAADLEFEIRSVKSSYLLAEPVFIDFTLRNTSSTEGVLINTELDVEMQSTTLFISRGDRDFAKYDPGFHIEPSKPPTQLGPLESVVHRQLVHYTASEEEFAFPSSGVYRIKAVYHRFGAAPDVESNIIEVRVTKPTGVEAEALELFSSREVAGLIMSLNEDSKAVADLELLMTRYRATIYGSYAQFYLARRQMREFFDRKPNYERALELYQDLIKRDPTITLATEVNYRIGVSLMKTGQYEDARHRFNSIMRDAEVTRMVDRARLHLEHIEKRELEKPN